MQMRSGESELMLKTLNNVLLKRFKFTFEFTQIQKALKGPYCDQDDGMNSVPFQ